MTLGFTSCRTSSASASFRRANLATCSRRCEYGLMSVSKRPHTRQHLKASSRRTSWAPACLSLSERRNCSRQSIAACVAGNMAPRKIHECSRFTSRMMTRRFILFTRPAAYESVTQLFRATNGEDAMRLCCRLVRLGNAPRPDPVLPRLATTACKSPSNNNESFSYAVKSGFGQQSGFVNNTRSAGLGREGSRFNTSPGTAAIQRVEGDQHRDGRGPTKWPFHVSRPAPR